MDKELITRKKLIELEACYDPKEIGFTDKMALTPVEFIDKFRNEVKDKGDVIWVVCHSDFMSDMDMRLFAVWCAREELKLDVNPDPRSKEACDVAEKYANGNATTKELDAARSAARSAAWDAQIDQLKEMLLN